MEVRAKTHYYDSSMSKSKNMFKDQTRQFVEKKEIDVLSIAKDMSP